MTNVMICNGLLWMFNPRVHRDDAPPSLQAEALGFLPDMLDAADPRPAREQFDAHYGGSYWQAGAAKRTTMDEDRSLLYPGDPPLRWAALTNIRDELVLVYPGGFVAVVAADGSFVMQRMD